MVTGDSNFVRDPDANLDPGNFLKDFLPMHNILKICRPYEDGNASFG